LIAACWLKPLASYNLFLLTYFIQHVRLFVSARAYQLWYSVFLSQKISRINQHKWLIEPANRLIESFNKVLSLKMIYSLVKWYCETLWKTHLISRESSLLGTVIRTGPDIKPVRLSVHWFTGPTVRNRLNRRFNCFGPDELDRPQILWTGTT